MYHGKRLNMNFFADQVSAKLKRGFPFHTALAWALSFTPYAGNFTHEEAAQIVGKILQSRKQAKKLAGSKKEKLQKSPPHSAFVATQMNLLDTNVNYPD